jgi:COX assembly protein 2
MIALEECHARGFLYGVLGGCNEAKHQVNMCLRAERIKRTQENFEKSKVKNQKVRAAWEEVDANS